MEQNQQVPVSKKRAHRSEEQIAACLKEHRRSRLTIKEYCENIGICENTFYRWRKYYGKQAGKPEKQPAVQNGFASIEVVASKAESRPQLFAEIGKIKLYKEVSAEYLKMLLS